MEKQKRLNRMDVLKLISKVECWPNENQLLLLKAALNKDQEAINSWSIWASKIDFENTDNGSYRLYPLVYQNLTSLNTNSNPIDIPKVFKGVYRYYWAYSNRLFIKTSGVIEKLINKKIPVLLLKGAPLALNMYENIALRPLNDVDIMVPYNNLNQTINILKESGFTPIIPIHKNTYKWRHAIGFKNNDGLEIDLHTSLFIENLNPKYQQTYWKNAIPMNFMGQELLTLSPTDHLFHTIAHGVSYNHLAPIRWIVDAIMICQTNSINWDRIVSLSKENKLTVKVLVALKYLQINFIDNIPEEVINKLNNTFVNRFEEREFLEKTKKNNRIKIHWFNYLRVKENSTHILPFSFISYLKNILGLKSVFQVPFVVSKKLLTSKSH